jgi:toxin ParE1/3/4
VDYALRWSPEAAEDVDAIASYIARDSGFYAQAVVAKILEIASGIAEQPLIGRVAPEFDDETLRERFVYSYRLIYKLEKESVLVVAVIHGKRLLENVPERFS